MHQQDGISQHIAFDADCAAQARPLKLWQLAHIQSSVSYARSRGAVDLRRLGERVAHHPIDNIQAGLFLKSATRQE